MINIRKLLMIVFFIFLILVGSYYYLYYFKPKLYLNFFGTENARKMLSNPLVIESDDDKTAYSILGKITDFNEKEITIIQGEKEYLFDITNANFEIPPHLNRGQENTPIEEPLILLEKGKLIQVIYDIEMDGSNIATLIIITDPI